jgi:hypothetical protein
VTTIFPGAGFGYLAGAPLASQLFDEEPEVDKITRQRLVQRVVGGWQAWHAKSHGTAEEYLSVLQSDGPKEFVEAAWFVALRIAIRMGSLQVVGGRPAIVAHNITRAVGVPAHQDFWAAIFKRTKDVAVITPNYDILCERGLRTRPTPLKNLPGFNYGLGPEQLEGRGYPSFAHLRPIACTGTVPLHKIHGSVSWSIEKGRLVKYQDCRPAIRGDAAIIAPVQYKEVPPEFGLIWNNAARALAQSSQLIIVGYSLPEYDVAIKGLLHQNLPANATVHVFDPQAAVAERYKELFGTGRVFPHPGLPDGIRDFEELFKIKDFQ